MVNNKTSGDTGEGVRTAGREAGERSLADPNDRMDEDVVGMADDDDVDQADDDDDDDDDDDEDDFDEGDEEEEEEEDEV